MKNCGLFSWGGGGGASKKRTVFGRRLYAFYGFRIQNGDIFWGG